MISLLGTLLGFGTSIVPEVLGYFKQKQANEQELAMLEAKAKYADRLSELKIRELDAEADIAEAKSIYAHDANLDSAVLFVLSLLMPSLYCFLPLKESRYTQW